MSESTRRINAALGRTVGIQLTRSRARPVRLSAEWFVRFVYFNGLVERVASVPGDLVECGVASGSSLAMLASLTRATGRARRAWGFDSWEGLPPPSQPDLTDETSIAAAGMFAHASTRRVHDELVAYGWSHDEILQGVRLVPGLFERTLPGWSGEIALLHLDADLYESYRTCLTHLWPRLQLGGIVAFDEYDEPEQWPGARKAVDEFLRSLPDGAAQLRRDDRSGKWWAEKRA